VWSKVNGKGPPVVRYANLWSGSEAVVSHRDSNLRPKNFCARVKVSPTFNGPDTSVETSTTTPAHSGKFAAMVTYVKTSPTARAISTLSYTRTVLISSPSTHGSVRRHLSRPMRWSVLS
jgi:hypothetical protein